MEEDIDAIAGLSAQTYRIMLVQDKQCNGAPFLNSDLVLTNYDDGIGGGAVKSSLGYRNLAESGRFRVLWDSGLQDLNQCVYKSTGADGDQSFGRINKSHEIFLNLKKPIIIEYSGVTGGDAEIRTNNLQWIWYQDDIAPPINVRSSGRIKYTDM